MKKITICLIMGLLLTNITFAKTMTLDEAVNFAKENNASVLTLKAQKRSAEKEYNTVKSNTGKWQSKRSYSFEDCTEYMLFHGYALEEAELKYNLYLKQVEAALDSVEYGVESYAYSIDLLDKEIALAEDKVESLENELKIAELKYKLHIITDTKVDEARLQLETAKSSLKNATDKKDIAKQSLKNIMGIYINEEIDIQIPEIQVKELEIDNIDEFIEQNIENNVNTITARYKYKTCENNYRAAKEGGWYTTFETKTFTDAYKVAETALQSQTNSIKIGLKDTYNKIKSNEIQIKETEKTLEIYKNNLENAKKMYDLGMISKVALINAGLETQQMEYNYNALLMNNLVLNETFRISIKSGASIASDN
jgi:outer membrane protein TolC